MNFKTTSEGERFEENRFLEKNLENWNRDSEKELKEEITVIRKTEKKTSSEMRTPKISKAKLPERKFGKIQSFIRENKRSEQLEGRTKKIAGEWKLTMVGEEQLPFHSRAEEAILLEI